MSKGKRIAALICVLTLFCALIFVAYELFQIRAITVSGNNALNKEQVEALSGLDYGQSIFFVNEDQVMEALASDPYISPVSVKIEYPYTVVIEIAERTPAAYIDTNGVRLTIDSDAVVLEVDTSPAGEVYPMVVGISTDRFEVGQALGEDAYKRSVLSGLLGALRESGMEAVRIDLTYSSALKVGTKEGYAIELGDAGSLPKKLQLARYAMDDMLRQGKMSGIIDVSTGEKAYCREN